MDLSHLDKYKDLTFRPTGTLFEIDLSLATEKGVCPLCMCKLYEMRNRPYFYCRSTRHKDRFIIGKEKVRFKY